MILRRNGFFYEFWIELIYIEKKNIQWKSVFISGFDKFLIE